jgi:hypothetical protein
MKGLKKPTKKWLLATCNYTQQEVIDQSRDLKGNPDYMKPLLLRALKLTLGIIGQATDMCNITRNMYYQYAQLDPEFAAKAKEITQHQIDFVESKLIQGINEKNPALITYYLTRKGASNGYGEQQLNAPTSKEEEQARRKSQIDFGDGITFEV